jgi:hypothetical protein
MSSTSTSLAPGASQSGGGGPAAVEPAAGRVPSKVARWGGLAASGIAVLFLVFDAAGKVLKVPPAVAGTIELGYPEGVIVGLGVVQIACLIAYLVPHTSVLGAILWTGYLGGAIATHVRVENPLLTHVLFPVYVAALLWGGLWLRDPHLRRLLPLTGSRQPAAVEVP